MGLCWALASSYESGIYIFLPLIVRVFVVRERWDLFLLKFLVGFSLQFLVIVLLRSFSPSLLYQSLFSSRDF